jgi:hypothetical protein
VEQPGLGSPLLFLSGLVLVELGPLSEDLA